jgi:hypothetical protein
MRPCMSVLPTILVCPVGNPLLRILGGRGLAVDAAAGAAAGGHCCGSL